MEGETVGRKQRRGREFWSFLSHCVALSEINEKLTFVIAVQKYIGYRFSPAKLHCGGTGQSLL